MISAWLLFGLLLVAIFWFTHGGFGRVKSQLSLMLESVTHLNR
jgi:hypothetical protein